MEELYTLDQVAKKAGVSLSTIKRDILEGRLVPTRIRGCVKIHPQDWETYLQQCRSAGMARDGKSGSSAQAGASPDHFAAVAMLPSLKGLLDGGPKIIALDARRNTRSRKRSRAG